MRTLLLSAIGVALTADLAPAAGPTTKPRVPPTPVYPRDVPPLTDSRAPAFIPRFSQIDNPPAGRFAERQYASRYTYPAPVLYAGYAGWFGGYGYAGWRGVPMAYR